MEEQFEFVYDNVLEENVLEEKTDIKDAFVTGLPDWDLEPLYEPIKRGDKR